MMQRENPDPSPEKRRFKEFLDLEDESGLEETSGARPANPRPPDPDPWANEPKPSDPDPRANEPKIADPDPYDPGPLEPALHELEPYEPAPYEPDPYDPEALEAEPGDPEPARVDARHEPEYDDADGAVRRLLKVTGAVVLVLVILAVTDALIIHASYLAFIAIAAALFFYAGFIARGFAFHWPSKVGFAVMVGLFCVTAYLGWRGKQTALGLAHLITPVPEIVHVARVPTGEEISAALALSATLEALEGAESRQRAGLRPDTAQRSVWERLVNESGHRYWVVETELTIPQVMEFYARPENLAGWTVAAERPEGLLSLRRGEEQLLIMASDGFPSARSEVGYLYIGVE